jgi:hypothetical protein
MLEFDCVDEATGDAVGDCIFEYAFSQVNEPTLTSIRVIAN